MAEPTTTPLVRKLGIKAGASVLIHDAPASFAALLGDLPEGVVLRWDGAVAQDARFDVAVCFTTRRAELERRIRDLRPVMNPATVLWIAWPKRSSRLASEVGDDLVRAIALPTGLVDNKICAIDATWTALRLVIRRELRETAEGR